jgi:isopentenyl phosphate kinase
MKRRYGFERVPPRRSMGRIVMKWGGGLITNKSSLCTADIERIQSLANCVKSISELGHDIVIVHGAGSFGHIRARQHRLNEGNLPDLDQDEAVKQVRSDMSDLHNLVIDSLAPLPITSHAPRDFVVNTGADFLANLNRFHSPGIHVTFGDVVNCHEPKNFGILSGDDLMLRLSVELPDVTHAIFAMNGAPGLMTSGDESGELIPMWDKTMSYSGYHSEDVDVTGGIFLKVDRASVIAENIEHVWLVDGCIPSRIIEIVEKGQTVGTRFVSSP